MHGLKCDSNSVDFLNSNLLPDHLCDQLQALTTNHMMYSVYFGDYLVQVTHIPEEGYCSVSKAHVVRCLQSLGVETMTFSIYRLRQRGAKIRRLTGTLLPLINSILTNKTSFIKMKRLNPRNNLITSKFEFTSGADGLHFPWSVAMTTTGRLMLSEDYSWAVKIFSLPGTYERYRTSPKRRYLFHFIQSITEILLLLIPILMLLLPSS